MENLTLIQNIYTFVGKYLTVIQIYTETWTLVYYFIDTLSKWEISKAYYKQPSKWYK